MVGAPVQILEHVEIDSPATSERSGNVDIDYMPSMVVHGIGCRRPEGLSSRLGNRRHIITRISQFNGRFIQRGQMKLFRAQPVVPGPEAWEKGHVHGSRQSVFHNLGAPLGHTQRDDPWLRRRISVQHDIPSAASVRDCRRIRRRNLRIRGVIRQGKQRNEQDLLTHLVYTVISMTFSSKARREHS